MVENLNLGDNCCCQPGLSGIRQIMFPDGSKEGIIGLDGAMEELYAQGKPADSKIGEEIIERLKKQNYFAPAARQLYADLFLSEYKKFVETKENSLPKENNTMANQDNNQNAKKKGLFGLFKSEKKAENEGGCCNMKIVPKEQPAKQSNQGCCCNMKIVPKESTEDKTAK